MPAFRPWTCNATPSMFKVGTILVAEIAKRMGVGRTTFYAYFPAARARQGKAV